VLGAIVNSFRSRLIIILLVALIPLTRLIVGTSIGTAAVIGLRDLAIRYGYQRFQTGVMIAVIVVLIVLVSLIQAIGDWLAKLCDHRWADSLTLDRSASSVFAVQPSIS
jgi:ABC-type methionine transport system permease subunit